MNKCWVLRQLQKAKTSLKLEKWNAKYKKRLHCLKLAATPLPSKKVTMLARCKKLPTLVKRGLVFLECVASGLTEARKELRSLTGLFLKNFYLWLTICSVRKISWSVNVRYQQSLGGLYHENSEICTCRVFLCIWYELYAKFVKRFNIGLCLLLNPIWNSHVAQSWESLYSQMWFPLIKLLIFLNSSAWWITFGLIWYDVTQSF